MAKKVKIAALLLTLLVSCVYAVRYYTSPGYNPEGITVDWVCLNQGHAFIATTLDNDGRTQRCPYCGSALARVYMYYNADTGQVAELYREMLKPNTNGSNYEDFLVKLPGGQWVDKNMQLELATTFPVAVENPQSLRYAGPNSQYR